MKVVVLKCPQCGAQLESNRTLCEHCGTNVRLSDDKQQFVGLGIACPECGTTNQFGDKHCGGCGYSLISVCPIPSCHEENNVWRKFCRKCGRDIIGYHMKMFEDLQQSSREEMQHHQDAIDNIQQTLLPASKGRVLMARFIIGFAGALIAFAIGNSVGGVIALIITALVVYFYESSEIENLQSSLILHRNDLERLKENYQTSEAKLARIMASKAVSR